MPMKDKNFLYMHHKNPSTILKITTITIGERLSDSGSCSVLSYLPLLRRSLPTLLAKNSIQNVNESHRCSLIDPINPIDNITIKF
ncbi:hypothetical protein DERP_009513 [Dermatophagoides pteronyssinus]|uniref:Uncharacterized protein n=1 Tax=Dermatophagoides pteronyssinus TaxID=6956 RepID=A0ABQ8IUC6_DERPT|nr:hypothetical protein DERP_009513 [Dermatophagoides pteronyssinus]